MIHWLMVLLAAFGALSFQTVPLTPITPENVARLQSTARYTLDSIAPEGDRIETGWFVLSPDGAWLAAPSHSGALVLQNLTVDERITLSAEASTSGFSWTVQDARFSPASDAIAALLTDGLETVIVSAPLADLSAQTTVIIPPDLGFPVRVWFDSAEPTAFVWIEAIPSPLDPDIGTHQVARFSLSDTATAPFVQPTAPENDPESIVRIGRIPAPLAVTSTESGTVRLWDLETGSVRTQVDLHVPPVFGRVTETSGKYLVWRDAASQALNLLNFETGENVFVAELNGDYIQALLVTPDADVILSVYRGDTPSVTAWLSADGTLVDLGMMWDACTRVPDMVQLSEDGSTLVIGCDAGFEVWRTK